MKYKVLALWAGISIAGGMANAQDMKVRMVGYKDCHPDLSKLTFEYKPQYCSMSQQSFTFMVEGQNIAVLDEDSLKLSKLEIDGKDILYNRKGDDNFKIGSFPKVDENGDFTVFDVNIKSAPFGKIGHVSLEGTVNIMTSERMIIKERKGLYLTKGFSMKLGSLTISDKPIPEEADASDNIGKALSKGLKNVLSGNNDSLIIYVKGDINAFVSLEVYENGKKIDSGWYSSNDDEKTLNYSKPNGSIIDIKVKYWDALKHNTVPISTNGGV